MIPKRGCQVFLATSCSPDAEKEAAQEFPFYVRLAEEIKRQVGINTFLPHRDAPPNTEDEKLYTLMQKNIMRSDIILADIGAPSTDVGIMIGIANSVMVPIIQFYRSNATPQVRGLNIDPLIVRTDEQGIKDITTFVKQFYNA